MNEFEKNTSRPQEEQEAQASPDDARGQGPDAPEQPDREHRSQPPAAEAPVEAAPVEEVPGGAAPSEPEEPAARPDEAQKADPAEGPGPERGEDPASAQARQQGAWTAPEQPWQQQPQWGGQPGWGGQGYYSPGGVPWQNQQFSGQQGGQWQSNQWQGSQWQGGRYGGWPGSQNGGYQWSAREPGKPDAQAPKPKKKHRLLTRVVSVILAVTILSFAGYGVYQAATGGGGLKPNTSLGGSGAESGGSMPDINLNNKPYVGDGADPEGVLTPKQIYAKVSPSVVGVIAYLGGGVYGPQQQGSGIIMSSDGYVITNAHVVEGATRVEIVLVNGDDFDALVVGTDAQSDLAVLKAVDAKDLVPAEFGNSAELEVGERVCAIGNPSGLALQSTLTVGYVSALDRVVSSSGSSYNLKCIQTDAAINPGNSGGALINEFGQVVGINSIKVIDLDYEGIGFAIPINDALPIIQDLVVNKTVTGRPKLGITAAPVTAEEAQAYGIPLGLWVKGFAAGADIATKGVQIDDIITHVDGTPVYTLNDCTDILSEFKPGDQVTLTLYRMEGAVRNQTFQVDIILMSGA